MGDEDLLLRVVVIVVLVATVGMVANPARPLSKRLVLEVITAIGLVILATIFLMR